MRPILLLLALVAPASAAVPSPRAKVELSPKEGVWTGQRVMLVVTLYTPDLFAGVPSFDLPPIPGVVVLPPAGSPTIGSEVLDGNPFTTQRHEFSVYVQRPGLVRIPPFAVRFETNTGFGKPIVQREVTTNEVSFEARMPPGAEGLSTVIAARDLKVADVWQPEPKALKVGDAITRTITTTASDVPGMIFPPLRFDPIDMLAVYPKEPSVADRTDRGVLTGQRADAITFVCEQPGTVTIPARTFTWFDLDAKKLRTVELPGRTFEVAAIPQAAPATTLAAPPASTHWALWAASAAAAIGGLVWAIIRMRPRWKRFRSTRAESEPACFARFCGACRSDDPHIVYAALLQWLDRFGPMSLEDFLRRVGDPELNKRLVLLGDAAFGRPLAPKPRGVAPWDDLAARARAGRNRLLATHQRTRSALPSLNPSA